MGRNHGEAMGKSRRGTRQWDHGLAKNRFRASQRQLQRTPAVNGSATFDLDNIIAEETDEVDRFCDSSKARVGLQQILPWTMRWCDPEADALTTAPRSEVWVQPSVDRPHWDEVLNASQEDVDLCEDGETKTIARDGATATPRVFYITDDGQETTVEENEVLRTLFAGSTSVSTSWTPYRSGRSSALHRRLVVTSAPDVVQVGREHEDNATTKGAIDVQGGLETAQKGSSSWQNRQERLGPGDVVWDTGTHRAKVAEMARQTARRCDTANWCCPCGSRFSWVHRSYPLHCLEGVMRDTSVSPGIG